MPNFMDEFNDYFGKLLSEEALKLAGTTDTTATYVADDNDFMVVTLTIQKKNLETYGKVPKWINVLLTRETIR